MSQRFLENSEGRLYWLKMVLAGAWLIGLLLSWKLWLSTRTYPLCPLLPLPAVPPPWDLIWLGMLLTLLGLVLVLPRPRLWLLLLVILAGGYSLWDQSRWQPWFIQYLFMGAVLAGSGWPADRAAAETQEKALAACRFVLIGMYFWSGLHKLNATFATQVLPWLLSPFLPLTPPHVDSWIVVMGLTVPFVESGIGLGLLFPTLRPYAVAAAVAMHGFLLVSLGPWGLDFNRIVWPWNAAMALFVVILFRQTDAISWRSLLLPRRHFGHLAALVLFGAMPVFNFFSLWDAYLSANLYSGNLLIAHIYVSDEVRSHLPVEFHPYMQPAQQGFQQMDVIQWSLEELQVPPYPERHIYFQIARNLCAYQRRPGDVFLVILERPPPWSARRTMNRYDCRDLP